MIDCCRHSMRDLKCVRKGDKKEFNLPRRFSKKKCMTQEIRGFTMRSSCAPYKNCKKKGKEKGKRRKKSKKKKSNK